MCAADSCRARHFNLFGQRQRQTLRVGRLGQPDTDDLGTRDRDPFVDGVHQLCLLPQYVCGLGGLAQGAEPLDCAVAGWARGRALHDGVALVQPVSNDALRAILGEDDQTLGPGTGLLILSVAGKRRPASARDDRAAPEAVLSPTRQRRRRSFSGFRRR